MLNGFPCFCLSAACLPARLRLLLDLPPPLPPLSPLPSAVVSSSCSLPCAAKICPACAVLQVLGELPEQCCFTRTMQPCSSQPLRAHGAVCLLSSTCHKHGRILALPAVGCGPGSGCPAGWLGRLQMWMVLVLPPAPQGRARQGSAALQSAVVDAPQVTCTPVNLLHLSICFFPCLQVQGPAACTSWRCT